MASDAWKEWERIVARKIAGERRGAYTGGTSGGKTDVKHPVIAVECKLLSNPKFADLKQACRQAEGNGKEGQVPMAFVRKKGDHWQDALVVMRFETFAKYAKMVEEAGDFKMEFTDVQEEK